MICNTEKNDNKLTWMVFWVHHLCSFCCPQTPLASVLAVVVVSHSSPPAG